MKLILFVTTLFFIATTASAQGNKKPIARIIYKTIPVSQYSIEKGDLVSTPTKGSALELLNGYKSYYTLLINLKTRASIYEFDSLVTTKVRGRESDNVSAGDEVHFCFKPAGNTTYKSEGLFNQSFKTIGTVGDIEWVITNEKKQVQGFDCTKAVSKNKDLLMTVWFTNAIPVSSGPGTYLGLPGLVVWAEDFFRTVQLEKVEYSDNTAAFETKLKKYEASYIGKVNFTKEPVFILRKANLGNYFYKLILADAQK